MDQGFNLIRYGIVQEFIKHIDVKNNYFIIFIVLPFYFFWNLLLPQTKRKYYNQFYEIFFPSPSTITYDFSLGKGESFSPGVEAIYDYIENYSDAKNMQEIEQLNMNTGKVEYILKSVDWKEFLINKELNIWGRTWVYEKKERINGVETTIDFCYLKIYSYDITSKRIAKWVEEITDRYVKEKGIKFKNRQKLIEVYYYKGKVRTIINDFESNITFENNHFPQQEDIIQKVNFFQNNKDFYREKGVKRSLNILSSGPPGTGKTGLTKAIINMTKRNVVMLKLSNDFPTMELENILKGIFDNFFVSVENTIFVIEEIDLLSDIFNKREEGKANAPLGVLLNAIDGIPECNGRMIMMTTNRPEKLDKALLRPGRVDIHYDVKNFTKKDIYLACKKFWKDELNIKIEEISDLIDDKYVSAYIMNKNISCSGDINKIISFLKGKDYVKRISTI